MSPEEISMLALKYMSRKKQLPSKWKHTGSLNEMQQWKCIKKNCIEEMGFLFGIF